MAYITLSSTIRSAKSQGIGRAMSDDTVSYTSRTITLRTLRMRVNTLSSGAAHSLAFRSVLDSQGFVAHQKSCPQLVLERQMIYTDLSLFLFHSMHE